MCLLAPIHGSRFLLQMDVWVSSDGVAPLGDGGWYISEYA